VVNLDSKEVFVKKILSLISERDAERKEKQRKLNDDLRQVYNMRDYRLSGKCKRFARR
jgi:hypothetical protein